MIVILMGVTGVGKTTVGMLLAQRAGMSFYDADDFHPAANIEKLRAGVPLQDGDRWPWLDRLNQVLREARGRGVVLACSALKESYRKRISAGCADIRFVLLGGTKSLIAERLAGRKGHYMNPALLDSQLNTLEPPAQCLALDITNPPELLVEHIVNALLSAEI